MYLEFFGFEEKPFNVTPDTRYMYPSPMHRSVLDTLRFGLQEKKGFLLLTGEVGTGKTLSVRSLLEELKPRFETSLIFNPQMSRLDLLKTINADLGNPLKRNSFKAQLDCLNGFVLEADRQGKSTLVIIDEAQNLSEEALEMTRILSNLETDSYKLLQILLVGQPELEEKLAHVRLRQLRQRIQLHLRLHPLDKNETAHYIIYRVQKAGPVSHVIFERDAVDKIHALTQGIPRLINTVCEYTLMAAYVKNVRVITKTLVKEAFKESEGVIPYVTYT